MNEVEVLVIGGGMAGVSVAAHLSEVGSVVVLEQEEQCAHHSTGRSAAVYLANYGNAQVRKLNRASLDFFKNPNSPHWRHELLSPRGALHLACAGSEGELKAFMHAPDNEGIEALEPHEIHRINPHVILDQVVAAAYEVAPSDIDVNELMMGYTRWLKQNGGEIHTRQQVTDIARQESGWRVKTQCGAEYTAQKLVNAAGAWADRVAGLAGLAPLGITPLRRSAALVPLPPSVDTRGWPLMMDVAETFYCKPDAGKLMISPADETPVEPHDAFADDFTIAETLDRVLQFLDVEIDRVDYTWAGLRSFAPDRYHVIGEDPRLSGFYWLAGQGGYGIQSAPAAAQLLASVVTGQPMSERLQAEQIRVEDYSPARLLGDEK